jgi:osmoprotectant transport system permease protein
MTGVQSLLRLQLPLAAPGIFAGLRTSLVLIVGTATLGNFVGGGGLGDLIAAGYGNFSQHVIITGAVLVAALAILSDWALSLVETAVTPTI